MNISTATLEIPDSLKNTKKTLAYIASQQYDLQEVTEGKKTSKYHLEVNEHSYYVGVYVYHILNQIKLGAGLSKIVEVLNDISKKQLFSEKDVSQFIDKDIRKLFEEKGKKVTSVKSLFSIVSPERIKRVISPLVVLFNPLAFKMVFAAVLLINGTYFGLLKFEMLTTSTAFEHTNALQYVIYGVCLFLCLFFHEIGHAVAAIYYKITPKNIGFGLYFVFPALYCDLTEIWKLERKERIVINIAGIYFQLLVNSILVLALITLPVSDIFAFFLEKLILVNIIISIYNINPFFKFDGYWIYSDFFDIPNLRRRSYGLIRLCFRKVKGIFTTVSTPKKYTEPVTLALALYTVSYVAFMSVVWFFLIRFVTKAYVNLYHFFVNIDQFAPGDISHWKANLPMFCFAMVPMVIIWINMRHRIKLA